ncbi:MAG: tryptophan--tRNA ligase, partial [Candidatus Micrarchaeota archaeon]
KKDPMNMLTLNDAPELAKKKIMRAFTGGRATAAEQKEKGGEYQKCVIYELAFFHFTEDEKELEEMRTLCTSGKISCGECKAKLAEKIMNYLKAHQEKKKKMLPLAKKLLEKN